MRRIEARTDRSRSTVTKLSLRSKNNGRISRKLQRVISRRERELHSFNVPFQIYDFGGKTRGKVSFSNILAAV